MYHNKRARMISAWRAVLHDIDKDDHAAVSRLSELYAMRRTVPMEFAQNAARGVNIAADDGDSTLHTQPKAAANRSYMRRSAARLTREQKGQWIINVSVLGGLFNIKSPGVTAENSQ
jgi:hypothetical protein